VIKNFIIWATAVQPKTDLFPQRRVGCQHPVLTMLKSARGRNQRRQTLDQLERRQHQAVAAAGTQLDALIDQVVGVDFTPTIQRDGRASAADVPDRAVGPFDAYAGVE
jgi:hypothetical protein